MTRLERLQRKIGRGQALLLGSLGAFDANSYYYYGFEDFGAFLVTRGDCFAYTREPFGENWVKMQKFGKRQLPQFVREHKIKTLLFDDNSSLAPAALRLVGKAKLKPFGAALSDLRLVKDAGELKKIKTAQAITKKCVSSVLERGISGKTDSQVAGLLELEAREMGAALNSFEPIVLVNEAAAKPHGEPSGRRIGRNDLVLFDVGASYKHYRGDYSATVYYGKDEEIREAISAVKEAKLSAERKAKPCVKGSVLTKAALAVLKERGFGKTSFKAAGLSLGHHLGLQVHEGKRLDETRLRNGMAFTIEPGVYCPRYGVRFEDMKIL